MDFFNDAVAWGKRKVKGAWDGTKKTAEGVWGDTKKEAQKVWDIVEGKGPLHEGKPIYGGGKRADPNWIEGGLPKGEPAKVDSDLGQGVRGDATEGTFSMTLMFGMAVPLAILVAIIYFFCFYKGSLFSGPKKGEEGPKKNGGPKKDVESGTKNTGKGKTTLKSTTGTTSTNV